jgi:hypothetical protein
MYNELSQLTRNLKHGQKNFVITYYKNYSEVDGFHQIVFLSNSNSTKIQKIKNRINNPHMMFVTEREGMGSYGSAISFFISKTGRIEFELMAENMRSQNLAYSAQLKTLSKKRT